MGMEIAVYLFPFQVEYVQRYCLIGPEHIEIVYFTTVFSDVFGQRVGIRSIEYHFPKCVGKSCFYFLKVVG